MFWRIFLTAKLFGLLDINLEKENNNPDFLWLINDELFLPVESYKFLTMVSRRFCQLYSLRLFQLPHHITPHNISEYAYE
jgi:hypothetical protein